MRAVVQRVRHASVDVAGERVGEIGGGFLILLGVAHEDGEAEARWLANKLVGLRVFPDDDGKMNRSLRDVGGGALVVSQFTLFADCRKGRRPSFVRAARPEHAEPLVARFCALLRDEGVREVQTGRFGAMMDVSLLNDGPVTLVLDTADA